MKEEYFPMVKEWMKNSVIPNHKVIIGLGKSITSTEQSTVNLHVGATTNSEMSDVLESIANAAADNPKEVKSVLNCANPAI